MGETRVDLLHLLEDLRDAYPGSLEETIVSEVVANALDSGARRVTFETDPVAATLTVVDDGHGMTRGELRRYHDLAATTKHRGRGIGFAGVGIKLGLLVCEDVLTETRRGRSHVATLWHLVSRHRAPWKWTPAPGLVAERGTAVRLRLGNPLSPLLDGAFVEATLRRHFRALLDPGFDAVLAAWYPQGVEFVVSGRPVERERGEGDRAAIAVRVGRRRKPSAVGYLSRNGGADPDDERGVAVSTLGKVIKRGWDWLGVAPAQPDRVTGLIEVPALAECLTLNKADFIKVGARGAVYLAHRKAIQQVVAAQLAAWGDAPGDEARKPKTRPIERDLEKVLVELADEFPLLATLVERHRGGQTRLPMGRPGGGLTPMGQPETSGEPTADEAPPAEPARQVSETAPPAPEPPPPLPGPEGPKRRARYGLQIRFERHPDDPALGRLVESTVWVNEAHPAYGRAVASRAEGYHLALTTAMAIGPLAVEAARVPEFVTAFLARWGESGGRPRGGR
jgi:Histidine kinase-, DNA gyrase B-, and HSP90-like ATPase